MPSIHMLKYEGSGIPLGIIQKCVFCFWNHAEEVYVMMNYYQSSILSYTSQKFNIDTNNGHI